jgi:ADP-ribose pyrophosphatase YjhB (NUDIX family)
LPAFVAGFRPSGSAESCCRGIGYPSNRNGSKHSCSLGGSLGKSGHAIAAVRGLWNSPSGFVEAGESLEEAALRESNEEAGLELPAPSLQLYRVASLPHMNQVYVGFRAELANEPVLSPGPEASEARFFSEAEVPREHLAFIDTTPSVSQDVFERLRQRQFEVLALTLRPTN